MWIAHLAASVGVSDLNAFSHPVDVLNVVGAHFGATTAINSLRHHNAHWRTHLNRFPTMGHFLADFRFYRQHTCVENDIDLDSPFLVETACCHFTARLS